jgi:hypothetical protein
MAFNGLEGVNQQENEAFGQAGFAAVSIGFWL